MVRLHARSRSGRFLPILATALGICAPASSPVQAQSPIPSSNRLTAAQVECNRAQLQALAERTSVTGLDGAPSPIVQSLLLTYSNRFGSYEGMVAGEPRFRALLESGPGPSPGPEHQLGFHLDPSVRRLLLNPARVALAQVSMTREVSTSNLVPADDPFAVQVRLRPTLGGSAASQEGDLVIDNLAASPPDGTAGFRIADTKPGRGLDEAGLTDLCHTRLTGLDRRVFAILERTLRVDLLDAARFDTRITLFRDEDPGVFGADVYLVDPDSGELLPGRMELRIEVQVGAGGDFRDGRLVVEGATGGIFGQVAGNLEIVRPVFGGVDEGYEPVASVPYSSVIVGPGKPQATFDWRDVLAGTEWGSAVGSAGCGQGTAAGIAATPRADQLTELLALAVGDGVTADPVAYDRLARDLGAIRSAEPEVAESPFRASYDGQTLTLVARDLATFEAIRDGTYDEWDCLNDWYGVESIDVPASHPYWDLSLSIRFRGRYYLEAVARDYAALDGIAAAVPVYDPPNPPPAVLPLTQVPSSLCVSIDGPTYRYFFDVSIPPSVDYFTTDPAGDVTFVGQAGIGVSQPPDWYPLVDACYRKLRLGYRPEAQ